MEAQEQNKIKLTIIIPTYNQEKLIVVGLDSIPTRDDIETLIINDGSTDNTLNTVLTYIQNHPEKNIRYHSFEKNKGVAAAVNYGYDNAIGEYVVLLSSDGDYFCHPTFEQAFKQLDGTDMVYFNIEINNGDIWYLNPETHLIYGGSVKFIRREFLQQDRCPENIQLGEDAELTKKLLSRNPTEKYTNLVVKHYNWPRKGSLTWEGKRERDNNDK